jgi:hypothetical protein
MRMVLPVLALAGLVAACANEPRVVNSTPPGISYRFQGDNISDANARADRYCQQYGMRARLQTVNRSGVDSIAVYQCS